MASGTPAAKAFASAPRSLRLRGRLPPAALRAAQETALKHAARGRPGPRLQVEPGWLRPPRPPRADYHLRFDEARPVRHRARDRRPAARWSVPDAGMSDRRSCRAAPSTTASRRPCSCRSASRRLRNVVILGWAEPRDITPDDVALAELAAALAAAGFARLEAHARRATGLDPAPRGRPRRQRAQCLPSTCRRPAHARPPGRARARGRPLRRLPRQRRARARSRPPAPASPRACTACGSAPARASRATRSRPADGSSATTTRARSSHPTSLAASGLLSVLAVPMDGTASYAVLSPSA